MGKDIELGKARGGRRVFLPEKVRTTHMHVLGASGRGKSKFLEGMLRRDIINRNGVCLIDPHGYLYHDVLRWMTSHGLLKERKIYLFDPSAPDWSFAFNPLDFGVADVGEISFAVDAMVQATAQVWGGEDSNQTPLLKRCLRSIFHALAEKKMTLLEAMYLASAETEDERRVLTDSLADSVIAEQWRGFNAMSAREFREAFSSTNNRLIEFLASRVIRNTIGHTERLLDLGKAMDEGAIVLVNLASAGRLSDDNARLLGTLLVNDLFLKARRRAPKSRPFYLYIDECSLFVSNDIARILDEGRKFGLHLVLAHQHLEQLRKAGEVIHSSVMTNAQTKVVFGGLSVDDARIMAESLFSGEFDLEEAKVRYNKPVVVGHIRTWLNSFGESRATAQGTFSGLSSGTAEGSMDGSDLVRTTMSSGESSGSSSMEAEGYSTSQSEAFESVYEDRPTTPYSLEEHIYNAMSLMRDQVTRQAVVKIPGKQTKQVMTPLITDPDARDERVETFKQHAFAQTPFARPLAEAEEEIASRQAELRSHVEEEAADFEPDDYYS